jgi:hypothetical protein
MGPCINSFPEIPAGAPRWNGQVRTIPRNKEWDYDQITHALATACREGTAINIFCDGLLSNKNRADNKQLGAASAVLYHEGKEFSHREKVFGETLTKSDTLIRSFSPALDLLTSYFSSRPVHTHPLVIITTLIPASQSSLGARGTPQVSGDVRVSSGKPDPPRPYLSGEYSL